MGRGQGAMGLALVLASLTGCTTGEVPAGGAGPVEEAPSRAKQAGRESSPDFEYSEDFEGPVGPEWSRRGTDVTPAGGRRFLGRFSQQSVRLKLRHLPEHDTVRLSFDLYVIGSWDGNSPRSGPDRWRLRVKDGPTLVDTTFSNDVWGAGASREYFQAFPGRYPGAAYPGLVNAVERGTLGYPDTSTYVGVGDSVYRLNFQFRHSDDDVELLFEDLPRAEAGESWGLDNVRVTLGSDDERGGTQWVRMPEGPDEDYGTSIAVDRDRNVVTVGSQGVYIEDETVRLAIRPDQYASLFVMKHREDGALLWARAFGGALTGPNPGPVVAVDRERDLYISAPLFAPYDFGGGLITTGRFLLKLDGDDGRTRGSRAFGGEGPFIPSALAVARNGDLLFTGTFSGTLDLGDGPVSSPGTEGACFIARFRPDGSVRWKRVEPGWSRCQGLAVDTEDDGIYVSGGLRDAAGELPFIERLSPGGETDWVRTLAGARGPSTAVAMHGNRVVAVGTFEGAFDFGGGRLESSAFTGTSGFAVAFTRAGDERWGRVLGTEATSVGMDPRDGVVVAGYYATGEPVAGQPLPGEPLSFRNLYAVKLDRIDGGLEWARGFPTEYGFLFDLAVDSRGASTLTGGISRTVDFGFGPVAPAPQEDVFILHLGP